MGKKLRQQRRGKGSVLYTKLPGTFDIKATYSKGPAFSGAAEVVRLINHTGHTAPLMEVTYDDFSTGYMIAPEGISIGDRIHYGKTFSVGSVMKLSDIPEGVPIFNIESTPGDGGKYVRSAGASAYIASHISDTATVLMPSKAMVTLAGDCRAQLGVAAGGGMTDQPIVKAGKAHYMMHTLNRTWPTNRGVKMNPVDHPFGGKQHHKGKSSMTSRRAPPGRKVGHIAASRTGRRKK
jgi:large subunit ribosomal protein L2